jgi:2-polyprenyl-3-methyl-5-hydroxy-6-metoxy-1,4-benzoquinol methylase
MQKGPASPTHTLEDPAASVVVRELADDRRQISVIPREDDYVVFFRQCETTYPLDLIELILRVKTPKALCDEILREESPGYVQHMLRWLILSHVPEDHLSGGRILDYGCGGGASTMILARMFPDAEIVGVDIDPQVLSIAHARLEHFGFGNVNLQLLETSDLGEDLGRFDTIVLAALYEHLLPRERKVLMPQFWGRLKAGGVLFVGETPHRYSPIEWHTTRLPLINYLPPPLALRAARAFSPRVSATETWEELLRRGIRGGARDEIIGLCERAGVRPVVIEPTRLGLRDTFDLWYTLATDAPVWLRRTARQLLRGLQATTGITFTPHLAFALRKDREAGTSPSS